MSKAKVFIVDNDYQADYKVFFVESDYQEYAAKLITPGELVQNDSQADVKVFIVDNDYQADIKIMRAHFCK